VELIVQDRSVWDSILVTGLREQGGTGMADRKQFLGEAPVDPELADLLDSTKQDTVSDEELREQRISFAFGNALNSETTTKESVRNTSRHIRLL
jgi:hypothetical protein